MALKVGMHAVVSRQVADEHTAEVQGSGHVPVLSTPVLINWCEQATLAAVESKLDDGFTSVGMRITLDHLVPSPVGEIVSAAASVSKVEGRRVTFAVQATHADGAIVGEGRVVRVLVDKDRFLQRLAEPASQ